MSHSLNAGGPHFRAERLYFGILDFHQLLEFANLLLEYVHRLAHLHNCCLFVHKKLVTDTVAHFLSCNDAMQIAWKSVGMWHPDRTSIPGAH